MFFNIAEQFDISSFVKPTKEESSEPKTDRFIGDHFHLPIWFLSDDEKHALSPIIAKDLELSESENQTMYQHVFDVSNHAFAEEVMPMYKEYFTSNIQFLRDSQTVIKNTAEISNSTDTSGGNTEISCTAIKQYWKHVKHDREFLEKYGYLDWSILKEYNRSSVVLQSICLANMLSPLSSFIIPFLFFLFPFVILKIQGVPITFEMYLTVLQSIAQHHFIGKAINGLQSMAFDKLIYVFGMLFLYLFQMYQNIIQCIRFYNNTERINKELCEWKQYLHETKSKMKSFLTVNEHVKTYKPFCSNIRYHLETLEEVQELLEPVCPFECNLYKITEVGYMLRCYYELYDNSAYEACICFSMGFNGYIELMNGLRQNLENRHVQCAEFKEASEVKTKPETDEQEQEQEQDIDDIDVDTVVEEERIPEEFITNQYYPPLKYDPDVITNNANLDSHNVITGPNASGKTTFLKTTALNIIFSQQLGVGFYDSCCLVPYTHMHSYLNIPDTSGRDSLFQAESRRCKEILDSIAESPTQHHFCIFDELYSGTNPEEATKAAHAFMKYVSAKPNVKLLLTTHYVSICDKWGDDNIENYQMEVLQDEDEFVYTYTIKPGISKVHGAVHILQQMDYPQSILDAVK